MASLFSALSSSLSGLQAVTSQMQIVSNNISNAGQAGYTKKSAQLSAISLGSDSGGGVRVTGFSRDTNDALTRALNSAISEDSLVSTQSDLLEQVQTIFDTTSGENASLSEAMAKLSSAWAEFSASPESSILKQQVLQASNNLAQTLQTTASDIEDLYRQTQSQVTTGLQDLEASLNDVRALNQKISQMTTAGLSAGDLEDQRDILIQGISELINVNVMARPNGQVALYTPEGYMLLDGESASFSYDGDDITSTLNPGVSLNQTLSGGKLYALVNFCADTGTSTVSTDPAVNVIQKLRSQLDLVASSLTDTTTPGTFGYAYAQATRLTGDAAYIFSASTTDPRTSLTVNPALMNGTQVIKSSSASAVAATFTDSTRSFTASGLSLINSTYETLVTGIVSSFQQAANSLATISETASSQRSFLEEKLANETGVNTDTEIVNLTTLQNAYAACARVMSVIQTMFDELERII